MNLFTTQYTRRVLNGQIEDLLLDSSVSKVHFSYMSETIFIEFSFARKHRDDRVLRFQ